MNNYIAMNFILTRHIMRIIIIYINTSDILIYIIEISIWHDYFWQMCRKIIALYYSMPFTKYLEEEINIYNYYVTVLCHSDFSKSHISECYISQKCTSKLLSHCTELWFSWILNVYQIFKYIFIIDRYFW